MITNIFIFTVKELLLKEPLKKFAANIYEAFSQTEPAITRSWTHNKVMNPQGHEPTTRSWTYGVLVCGVKNKLETEHEERTMFEMIYQYSISQI